MSSTKFYHVSPRRITVYTVLTPQGGGANFDYSDSPEELGWVYMTDKPTVHWSVNHMVQEKRRTWHLYEVKPLGDVWYDKEEEQVKCRKAVVVRYISQFRRGENKYLNETPLSDPKSRVSQPKKLKLCGNNKVRGRGNPDLLPLPPVPEEDFIQSLKGHKGKSQRKLRKEQRKEDKQKQLKAKVQALRKECIEKAEELERYERKHKMERLKEQRDDHWRRLNAFFEKYCK